MDTLAAYDNTLGFLVGHEVADYSNTSNAAVYVKAAALDLKKYRDEKGYRDFPVGYAGQPSPEIAQELQNYLACGSYGVDFYGLEYFGWCDNSDFVESGYSDLYANASGYSVPIFFAESGCTVRPRLFTDQAAILGPDMQNLWSGAIVYEWREQGNNYGLVSYTSSAMSGTPTALPSGGFSNLMSQWQTLTPVGTPSSLYAPNVTPPTCPGFTSSGWLVNGDVPLPTLNNAKISIRTTSSTTTGADNTNSSSAQTSSLAATGAVGNGSSENTSTNNGGLSTGAIVGIVVGVAIPVTISTIAAFLLWRRRSKQGSSPALDLSPDGLEVAATSEPQSISEGAKHETSNASSVALGGGLASDNAVTTSTGPLEMGQSPMSSRPISSIPSELSTTPMSPRIVSAQTFVSLRPSNITPALKANAPWENEAFPYPSIEITPAHAQQTPLPAHPEEHDVLILREDEPAES
jgi:hypothetical protein